MGIFGRLVSKGLGFVGKIAHGAHGFLGKAVALKDKAKELYEKHAPSGLKAVIETAMNATPIGQALRRGEDILNLAHEKSGKIASSLRDLQKEGVEPYDVAKKLLSSPVSPTAAAEQPNERMAAMKAE
jgi:hypothetical protein